MFADPAGPQVRIKGEGCPQGLQVGLRVVLVSLAQPKVGEMALFRVLDECPSTAR